MRLPGTDRLTENDAELVAFAAMQVEAAVATGSTLPERDDMFALRHLANAKANANANAKANANANAKAKANAKANACARLASDVVAEPLIVAAEDGSPVVLRWYSRDGSGSDPRRLRAPEDTRETRAGDVPAALRRLHESAPRLDVEPGRVVMRGTRPAVASPATARPRPGMAVPQSPGSFIHPVLDDGTKTPDPLLADLAFRPRTWITRAGTHYSSTQSARPREPGHRAGTCRAQILG